VGTAPDTHGQAIAEPGASYFEKTTTGGATRPPQKGPEFQLPVKQPSFAATPTSKDASRARAGDVPKDPNAGYNITVEDNILTVSKNHLQDKASSESLAGGKNLPRKRDSRNLVPEKPTPQNKPAMRQTPREPPFVKQAARNQTPRKQPPGNRAPRKQLRTKAPTKQPCPGKQASNAQLPRKGLRPRPAPPKDQPASRAVQKRKMPADAASRPQGTQDGSGKPGS
jgi:hypothetical protein